MPTITLGSDSDGVAADGHATKTTGWSSHRVLDGIGDNAPQEAADAFADAILEVGGAK